MMERRNRNDPTKGHDGDTSADGATSSRRAGRTRARLKPLESGSEAPERRRSRTERNRNSRERKSRGKRDEVDEVLDDIIGVVSGESEAEGRGIRARVRADQRKPSRFAQAQSSTEFKGREKRTPRNGAERNGTERDERNQESGTPREDRNGESGTGCDQRKRKVERRPRAVESPGRRHGNASPSPRKRKEDSSASPDRHRKRPVDSPGRRENQVHNPNRNLPDLSSPGSVPRFMSPLGKPPNPEAAAVTPKARPPKPGNHQGSTPTATKLAEKALRLPRLVAPGTSTPRSMGGSEAGTTTPGGGPQAEHPAAKALRVSRIDFAQN